MNIRKNKRAQASNYLAVIIFLFIFAFICILTYTVWINFVTALTTTGFAADGTVAAAISGFTNGFRSLDYVMVIFMVMLILATGYSSYLIRTDTAFFIVTLISSIFWGFISYFFNHVFLELVSRSVFDTAMGFFPKTLIICTNLHWIMMALIIVGSITLYGKKKEETADTFLT